MIRDIHDVTSFKWATVTGVNPLAIKLDGDTSTLALIPDSLVDPLEMWVGARVRVELSVRKCVIHGVSESGGSGWSGEMRMTARSTAPAGWLLCQGQSLLRSQYPRLFAAIGTTYGSADSTRFSLPDTRGRVIVGRDTSQTEFDALGEEGGAKTHTLSEAEIPSHNHPHHGHSWAWGPTGNVHIKIDAQGGSGSANQLHTWQNHPGWDSTDYRGGGAAHNNLQPYIVANYIIKI